MSQATRAVSAASRYLRRNPGEVPRAIRNALGLRVGVPLDLFRWLAEHAEREGHMSDVVLTPRAPGFHFSATISAMGTPVRASSALFFDHMHFSGDELRIELRIEDLTLELAGESDSPVAMLIKSGALDLSRPGNLVKHVPNLPAFLVSADENRIVLDLMRHPQVENNALTRSIVALFTSILTVHGIQVNRGHMDISLRAVPEGVLHAARSIRRHVVSPGIRRARFFLPRR